MTFFETSPKRKNPAGWIFLAIFIIAAGAGVMLPSGYVIERPGTSFNVNGEVDGTRVISVSQAESFQSETRLDVLTVSVLGNQDSTPGWIEIFLAWITPYHVTVDKVGERFLGKKAIGTTGRGIGPTYSDKIGRLGIRIQDLFDPSILRQKVEGSLNQKNELLVKVYNRAAVRTEEVVEHLLSFGERLRPMVADTSLLLNNALDEGKTVLLEGGQGTLLDIDHGTYPFVTSSNASAGGATVGSGIGPTRITGVIGILKAYTTRVGSGPFPTELFDEWGEFLRSNGGEFGVTTGRERRCGWFDAPIARYATRINGLTDFFLTKLDVLTGLEEIPVCVAYEIDGQRVEELPANQSDFHHAKPIYENFPGWTEDITGCTTFEELPKNAQDYVLALEKMSGTRISAIGVGQDRNATIVRYPLTEG